MKFLKKIHYFHYISLAVCLGLTAVVIFCFPYAFTRICESIRDLVFAVGYYFCELFEFEHNINPTVIEFSSVPFELPFNLPNTWEEFCVRWGEYWTAWVDIENFQNYLYNLSDGLLIFSRFLLLGFPIVLCLIFFFKKSFEEENNNYNVDSKPLKVYFAIRKNFLLPVKYWFVSFIDFQREHKYYKYCLFLLCYAFNFISIVVSAFAYYFYFVVSFNFLSLYTQVVKLVFDLSPMLNTVPLLLWVVLTLAIINVIRKSMGFNRLNHIELMNRGFINERQIVSMFVGSMGKGKTTGLVGFSISADIMFRDKALEKLIDNALKFPNFPWVNFELSLKQAMDEHIVYNLASCRVFVDDLQRTFEENPCRENIFDYDLDSYPYTYDDNLKIVSIWETLKTYAQLYFIYIITCSRIIGNLSVRTDCVLMDKGNFPIWDTDLFHRDSAQIDEISRYSKILDFDSLRLGKKVVENNAYKDSFEFGVVDITEIGKERKNTLELRELKKLDKDTNQKSDGFNNWLKMVRHSATVDGYPFVVVVADEQRPESWGADAKDLCEIIHIRERTETKLAMPFYFVGELLHEFIFSKFVDWYLTYRFNRGDNTLLMHLIKNLSAKVHNGYTRTYNQFGYSELVCDVERGSMDGEFARKKFYIINKKDYAKRFATDCFSGYYTEKALRSEYGINDLPEYSSERATFEELNQQNSYWVTELKKYLLEEDNQEDK